MRKQITPFELIRISAALVVGLFVQVTLFGLGWERLDESYDLSRVLVLLFGTYCLSSFVAVLVACVVPSWRYKTIAGTLMLMGATIVSAPDFSYNWPQWDLMTVAFVNYSLSLSGALLGVLMWRILNQAHTARLSEVSTDQPLPMKRPKTSTFLLALSLLSIPFSYLTLIASSFLVLGFSALLVLLLIELPRIPVVLLIGAGLAPLASLFAGLIALRAVIFPEPSFQMAHEIDLPARPNLNRIVGEVCEAVGTRQPKHVLLHAEPTFFVTQQRLRTFDGTIRGRTLAMGMPLLPHLTEQELKSILAHEFAHFSGKDTLYSTIVAQNYRSLGASIGQTQARRESASGCAGTIVSILLIPSVFFQITLLDYFASIDAIISRSRELRADWIAVQCFGTESFISALQKVVAYGAHFGAQSGELDAEHPDGIFAQHRALAADSADALQSYVDVAMQQPEHERDSHPPLSTRIAAVPNLHGTQEQGEATNFFVELVPDERKLSDTIRTIGQQMRAYAAQFA